jgi:hypothetical protein
MRIGTGAGLQGGVGRRAGAGSGFGGNVEL